LPAIQIAPINAPPAVLLVDDEKVVLVVMARMLEAAGFSLVAAESGEQALEHLGRQQFACALVDKNLQGMDGLEVIRHVRKRQPRCACIMMTAYASTGSAVEALRLGVVDYLAKPSPELDRIAERIQEAIRAQGVREQQGALLQRVSDLEKEAPRKESERTRLEVELGFAPEPEIDGPVTLGAPTAVRAERDQRLLRGAEAIVARLTSLREQLKAGAHPVLGLDRLVQEATTHLALLRGAK
jgi:CheY-like chemotaxis protein